MGREIRRVPIGWEHPTQECRHSPWAGGCSTAKMNSGQCYKPLYDQDFEAAMKEWLDGLAEWMEKGFQEFLQRDEKYGNDCGPNEPYRAYCEWEGGAPDADSYRSPWASEPTAFQMYETVSEGTPVSPVCETKEALIDYLVNHGDYWSQMRAKEEGGDPRWSRAAAEGFVESEYAPSMIAVGGQFFEPSDAGMYGKEE